MYTLRNFINIKQLIQVGLKKRNFPKYKLNFSDIFLKIPSLQYKYNFYFNELNIYVYITKTNPAIKKILILRKYYLSRIRKSGVPLVQ